MLQRQGRFGTYAPIWGQEACQIGSTYVLQKGDWVFPAFREIGATLMMGIPLKTFYLALSFDHRVVDGGEAARFLNTVIARIEDPDLILLET